MSNQKFDSFSQYNLEIGQKWISDKFPEKSFEIIDIFLDERVYPLRDYSLAEAYAAPRKHRRYQWVVCDNIAFETYCERMLGRRPNRLDDHYWGVFPIVPFGSCSESTLVKRISKDGHHCDTNIVFRRPSV